ncbi:MAG: carboxypeptidase-like regulatory domain-containing protein [Bacteroidota bacterium]
MPTFNLLDGQGGVYGKVTRRNITDNSIQGVKDAVVSIFDGATLVVSTRTNDDGIFIFDAINAPRSYTIEFRKEAVVVADEFTIASKEVKQINVELS